MPEAPRVNDSQGNPLPKGNEGQLKKLGDPTLRCGICGGYSYITVCDPCIISIMERARALEILPKS